MKAKHISTLFVAAVVVVACHSTKSTTAASSEPSTTSQAPAGDSWVFTKPVEGTYEPGEKEVTAIRSNHKEATLAQLKQGYTIYKTGACVGCHGAANIYDYTVAQWEDILYEMSAKAQLTEVEKSAVYNYVMSIKSVQQTQGK